MAGKSKTSKKMSKKLDKLEKQAEDIRAKAERKGKELTAKASDRLDQLTSEPEKEKGGGKGMFLVFLAAIAGALFALKRKRDQELDEALWEEPRSI